MTESLHRKAAAAATNRESCSGREAPPLNQQTVGGVDVTLWASDLCVSASWELLDQTECVRIATEEISEAFKLCSTQTVVLNGVLLHIR